MTDLVERLRQKSYQGRPTAEGTLRGVLPVNPDGPEAADHIDAQAAEITRLREEVEKAERDRDDLLQAAGFRTGPLGDETRRKVILADISGLRPSMSAARKNLLQKEGDAMLWQMSCTDGRHAPLLLTVWRRAKDAEARIKELEASESLLEEIAPQMERIADMLEAGDLAGILQIRAEFRAAHPDVFSALRTRTEGEG